MKRRELWWKATRWPEAALWLLGLGCACWWAAGVAAAVGTKAQAEDVEMQAPVSAHTVHTGELLGRLEIAAVGLSVPMLENYDNATLRRGVGHVPGTAVPGGLGNLVLAGHRDTFFRPLRAVHPGMEIRVVVPGGAKWRYVIDRTEVVRPEQTAVLDIGDVPEMTLVTCFPFEFVGAAPERFIVHAHLLQVDAS